MLAPATPDPEPEDERLTTTEVIVMTPPDVYTAEPLPSVKEQTKQQQQQGRGVPPC